MITKIPIQILPIEEDGFHLMTTVKINGKKANLIIDTGASRTIFDETLIKNFLPKSQIINVHKKKKKLLREIRSSKLKTSYEKRSLNERPDESRFQFDELIRVPLLFVGCGVKSVGNIPNLVRTIDIFPTIESILNLPNKKLDIHGRSLYPFFENKQMEEIPVYMESTTIHTGQKEPKAVIGLRTSRYKYFRSLKIPTENRHLYDLKIDPFEGNNLVEKNSAKVNEMEKLLENIRNETNFDMTHEKFNDAEAKQVEEELKKLGYI